MLKKRNIKIYNVAFDYLLNIKPQGVCLDKYFLGENRDYHSLTDVYLRFIESAQNYQAMPNIIAFEKRKKDIASILFDFDVYKIAEIPEDKLYSYFRKKFNVTAPDNRNNSWLKWTRAVIDSAKFLSGFADEKDFDTFVKRFDYNVSTRMALPLLIQAKIRGIGFALACDALKELGYTNYPKPDKHLIDVFAGVGLCANTPISVYEAVAQMADDSNETPYKVDKVFWLICSGNYYHDGIKENSHKQELITLLKQI